MSIYEETKNPLTNVIYKLLYAFVEWHRMLDNKNKKFIAGQTVSLNWKGKVQCAAPSHNKFEVIKYIESKPAHFKGETILHFENGTSISSYWMS